MTRTDFPSSARQLRAGDIVEVLSEVEILATLDGDGTLDGLPFMPEMLASCGQKFTVDSGETLPVSSGMRRG